GRASWRPFPLPIRKGQRPGCPLFCAQVDGLEPLIRPPAAGRQAIFLGATEPRAARPERKPAAGDASRPRPVGGVNELVKYAEIDVRCAAAPAPWRVDSNSMKGPPRNAANRLHVANSAQLK